MPQEECRRARGPGRGPAAIRRAVVAFLALLVLPTSSAAQDSSPQLEHQVKAAFLYNFARFVEWPPDTLAGEDSFVIGVLGTDDISRALEATVQGKMVGGRTIRVRSVKNLDEAALCHMLFLATKAPERLSGVLEAVRGSAVLTVADREGFAREGGIVNFVMRENHVRFAVNTDAAERAGLRISSKLLQLAIIVRDANRREEPK